MTEARERQTEWRCTAGVNVSDVPSRSLRATPDASHVIDGRDDDVTLTEAHEP